MSDTDQKREDEVLRHMLNTPPTPHKPPDAMPKPGKKLNRVAVGAIIALCVAGPARADAESCSNAATAYRDALSTVDSTLRRYTRCFSNADTDDDCSTEFRRLRRAHDALEEAIRHHRYECPDV